MLWTNRFICLLRDRQHLHKQRLLRDRFHRLRRELVLQLRPVLRRRCLPAVQRRAVYLI
jgi:hypothetical protein